MDQAISGIAYVAEPSKLARGMIVIRCPGDDFTSPTAKLAEEFSGGRFSYREGGWLLSSVAARHFTKAHSLGCRATRGVIEWESPGGEQAVVFSAKHPRHGLKCIADMRGGR